MAWKSFNAKKVNTASPLLGFLSGRRERCWTNKLIKLVCIWLKHRQRRYRRGKMLTSTLLGDAATERYYDSCNSVGACHLWDRRGRKKQEVAYLHAAPWECVRFCNLHKLDHGVAKWYLGHNKKGSRLQITSLDWSQEIISLAWSQDNRPWKFCLQLHVGISTKCF